MDDKTLENLKKFMAGMNPDFMKKQDAEAIIKKLLDFVSQMDGKYSGGLDKFQKLLETALNRIQNDHAVSMGELKKVFKEAGVGEQMKAMLDEHNALKTEHKAKLASIKDGKTPIKGRDYFDGINGKDGTLIKAEEIRDKLESLEGEDRLDASAIKGLEAILSDIKGLKQRPTGNGGMMGRDLIKDVDISASFNGSTKTFNIHGIWNIISVSLSSYPFGSLRKNIDYTFTTTTITFGDTIDAATQLAAGQQGVLTVVSA